MKTTRRLAASVLVCLSVAAAALTASAASPIKVFRNGTETVAEASPVVVEGQVMIPLALAEELFAQRVDYDAKDRVLHVDERSGVVSKSEDGSLWITGTLETKYGMWDELRLHGRDRDVYLPGKTLGADSSYEPEFKTADLTGGGSPDTIVLLQQGYGTGVYLNAAVVYDGEWNRIPMEDALVAMLKQFKGIRTDAGVEIQANGVRTAIAQDRLTGSGPGNDVKPGIGSVLRYAVEDGRLTATAAVQVGTAEFVGDLKIAYTYENGVLQAGDASFAAYDEYR
ncbi:hypothetical protein QWJ34_09990 [Saccharibacillus sp. CPCC 101409]|uniref:hypothetical protein n=1 Tax=Saccharibacillus sp. CPCC 101409 TaxID=3058041 RepID=UPI0026710E44|nr:hypothetical protein [Saccharibacillus sp. CPCC 101409]MDO3410091.1 hypothetical protein [Saccharibacillus sp. CPCC 101409]